MVATRNHPQDFDDPETSTPASPTTTTGTTRKRTTRTSTTNHEASPTKTVPSSRLIPRIPRSASTAPRKPVWSHTPSNLTLIWLAISLPLVIWDTGYVLLRPYSMPGGSLHKPLWVPYGLYGTIDHVYGFKAYHAHEGWTAAQGSINALETLAYGVYLYIVYAVGQQEPRQGAGAPDKSTMGRFRALSESRTVYGQVAAAAVLIAYSTAFLTFWKTVLYWLNEAFSGWFKCQESSFGTVCADSMLRFRKHWSQRLGNVVLHVDHSEVSLLGLGHFSHNFCTDVRIAVRG